MTAITFFPDSLVELAMAFRPDFVAQI